MSIDTAASQAGIDSEQSVDTPLTLAQTKFYASDQYDIARHMLQVLVDSPEHDTHSSYYTGDINFSERHLDFLSKNPSVNLAGYMSNLKLMTRKRS